MCIRDSTKRALLLVCHPQRIGGWVAFTCEWRCVVLSSRPLCPIIIIIIIIIIWGGGAGLVERRVHGNGCHDSSAPAARRPRRLVGSPYVEELCVVTLVRPHGAGVVVRALPLPRPVTRQHRHHLDAPPPITARNISQEPQGISRQQASPPAPHSDKFNHTLVVWRPTNGAILWILSKYNVMLDSGALAPWYENMMSSTKPEVLNASQRRHRR